MAQAGERGTMADEAAVRVQGLTKRFGHLDALAGLSFEVKRGDIFGFIGPNGAGKTTTLRVLAGLARPTEGDVNIEGVDIVAHRAALGELTGYVPDLFGVYDSMTAAEYLAFYAACYRVSKRLIGRVVDDLLELVGLAGKREVPANKLSRGMKQRLCLARALVHDPSVLLLDEPASGLDPGARADMYELFRALQEMGKTLLLSSQVLPELAEICTSFGVIQAGRMVAYGPSQSLLSGPGLRRARVRARGDPAGVDKIAAAIEGVTDVHRNGAGTLEVTYEGPGAGGGGLDGPALLRVLVMAGVAVTDFREDGLELFWQPAGTDSPDRDGVSAKVPEDGRPHGPDGSEVVD
jgi:ABC-2 type transport system ATP-binding protein